MINQTAHTVSRILLASLLFLASSAIAPAQAQQIDPLENIGIPPFSAQIPIENGYVNPANGDLHLDFPLATFSERGTVQMHAALTYDSAIWSQRLNVTSWDPFSIQSQYERFPTWDLSGWRYETSADTGKVSFDDVTFSYMYCTSHGSDDLEYAYYDYWTWIDPSGAQHIFPIQTEQGFYTQYCGDFSQNPTYNHPTGDAFAEDSSGYHMYITNYTNAAVYAPDGTLIYIDPSVNAKGPKDTNGNYYLNAYAFNMTDTLGRTPVTTTINGNTVYFDVLSSTGSTKRYTITLEQISVYSNFHSAGSTLADWSGTITVVQSIQLPDGKTYSFGYDAGTAQGHYGELTSMTLSTGGQITYSYQNFADASYAATGKHITREIYQRVTPDGATTYTPTVITACTTTTAVNCQQKLTVQKPNGDKSAYTFNQNGGVFPIEADFYNGTATLIATQSQSFDYSHPQPCYWTPCPIGAGNVTRLSGTTTLPVPGGNNLHQTTQFCYDINTGNLLYKWEWNFYITAIIHDPNPPSSCSLYTGLTPNRTTTYTYMPPYSGSGGPGSNIANRPASVTVTGGGTVSQDNYFYDQATTTPISGVVNHDDTNYPASFNSRGNRTQTQSLISGTSNYLNTYKTYDMTGQVIISKDPLSNQTKYVYTDNFYNDSGDAANPSPYTPAVTTNAFVTNITRAYGTTIAETSKVGYYWGRGEKAEETDPNSQTIYYHYYDPLERQTSTKLPDGGWTYFVYAPSEMQVDTGKGITSSSETTNCVATGSACRHDQVLLDGLGRLTSRILVSDPGGQTTVATAYDSNGRVLKISNPYRSTSDSTYGWETPGYDGLNRVIQDQHQDGSISNTYYGAAVSTGGGLSSQLCSSSYGLGYPALKVDEAGKKLQSWRDGFGRLVEVDEPNSSGILSVGTCYAFDLNNNLTGVLQGTETRSFSYDFLSRLTAATNPESGATNYYYTTLGAALCSGDPNAVCRRTDARAITTTYVYDALNRLTSKTYSDSTPTISYSYDGTTCIGTSPCYNKGRRTGMTDTAGSESWSYDPMARVWGDKRITNSVTKTVTYMYNLDGSLATLTYPSGRTVNYSYNAAAQPISVVDTVNGIVYATSGSYSPNGALSTLSNASQFNSTFIYNSRLQPCWIYATSAPNSLSGTTACNGTATTGVILDLKYNFNIGAGDNGDVIAITNNRDTTRSQSFTYDQLNRISKAQTTSTFSTSPGHCWGELFQYDSMANFLSIGVSSSVYNGCTQQSMSFLVNSHNQISSPVGYVYDGAGNLTTVPAPGAASYAYNAENEMTSTSGVNYTYDGDGRRVQKSNGKVYWYGSGEVLDETDLSGNLTSEYILLGNKRIARRDSPSNNIYYYFADHLGTSRSIVQSGQTTPCYDADFYPFGGERAYTTTCTQAYKFTGKERDQESGNDYFGARYYSSTMGRFMSPDWSKTPSNVPYAVLSEPQSLNLYAYVGNNPLSHLDPDGHIDCSGDNAKGIGCQYIAKWNADHGISPNAKKSDAPGVPVKLPNGNTVADPHSKTGLLMSPTADLSDVAAAGKKASGDLTKIGLDVDLGKAVGTGGGFDYQRMGSQSDVLTGGFQQLPQFRDVSNFNVGLYAQQAGMSLEDTLNTAADFARHFSSNTSPNSPYGLAPQTAEFIKAGWQAGASGAFNPH